MEKITWFLLRNIQIDFQLYRLLIILSTTTKTGYVTWASELYFEQTVMCTLEHAYNIQFIPESYSKRYMWKGLLNIKPRDTPSVQ